MAGGVNPYEWIFPITGAAHAVYNATANVVGQPGAKLDAPGSPNVKAAAAQQKASAALAETERTAREAQRKQEADLAARTETPQEAEAARFRAAKVAQRLGGGKRRASETLTDPGMTLSGSY